MKKLFVITLILVVAITLISCNKGQDNSKIDSIELTNKDDVDVIDQNRESFILPIMSLTFFIPLFQSISFLVLSILGIYIMILTIKILKAHIKKGL